MTSAAVWRRAGYKWWVFAALAIGMFSNVSDHGSVIVALPTIADHFLTDLPTVQWVVIGYALSISAFLMPMGRLGDIVGAKRVYLGGLAVFVAGSVLAGLSINVWMLIGAKIFQGVGAGMTQGTGMAMILSAFSDEERGKALGMQMSMVGAGGVAGPAMGGFIVALFGWQWVFGVNALLGAIALVSAAVVVQEGRGPVGGRTNDFDWLGAVLSTGALLALLVGMTLGPTLGWMSPSVGLMALAFVILLGGFVWWELRTPSPMLDVRLFTRKLFALGVLAGTLSFLANQPTRFLIPFYLQGVLGFDPSRVGLIIVPGFAIVAFVGPLSGWLSDRYGWRPFNVGGLAASAVGLFLLALLRTDSSVWLVLAGLMFQSTGMGMFYGPNNSSIMSAVEKSRYGVVAGFLNLVRNSSNVASIAMGTAVVTAFMAAGGYAPSLSGVTAESDLGLLQSFTTGFNVYLLMMTGLLVAGMVASMFKGKAIEQPGPETQVESDGRSGASRSARIEATAGE